MTVAPARPGRQARRSRVWSWSRFLILTGAVAIAYFTAARLGLSLAFTTKQVTAVWPPTGIAIAALVLFGRRVGLGILVGAFLANAGAQETLTTAAGIAVGNTVMAYVGLAVLTRLGFDRALARTRDVAALVLAAGAGAAVSASSGVANLAANGLIPWSEYPSVWRVWWVGDAMGVLLVAPVPLVWFGVRLRRWSRQPLRAASGRALRLAEAAAALGLLAAVSAVIGSDRWVAGNEGVLTFLLFPLIIWVAWRFGPVGAAPAVLLVATIAVLTTVHDQGFFAAGTPERRLILLEVFLAMAALTGLALSAAVAERTQSLALLERHRERALAEQQMLTLLESAADAVVIMDESGTIRAANSQTEALFGYRQAELLGSPMELLVPQHLRAGHRLHVANYLRAPRARPMGTGLELWGRCKDGREFPAEVSVGPLQTSDGLRVAAAVRDVTARKMAEHALKELAVIVESCEDAILAKTLDGTITAWNAAAERMYGYSAQEAIGGSVAMLEPVERAGETAEMLVRIRQGDRIEHLDTERLTKTGRRVAVELTISPIRGDDGTPVAASSIARDITERKRGEERLRLARRIGDELAASLDPVVIAGRLVEALVPALAAEAMIDLVEGRGIGQSPWLRRLAAQRGPEAAARAGTPARAFPDPLAAAHGRAPGDPLWVAYETAQPVHHPAALLRPDGARHAVSVPMRAQGSVIAVLTLLQSASQGALTEADLAWIIGLADRAGLAIDNGRLYERERHTALSLQRSLMGEPPELPGVQTARRYLPASDGAGVGGDWFDLIDLEGDLVGVIIGDVMGRGLEAAVVMGQLRSAAHALAKSGMSPQRLMTALDAVVEDLPDQLVTCCYLVVDPARGRLSVCSAGHLAVLVVESDASVRALDAPTSVPLGVGGVAHRQADLVVPLGSTLVLYTDGLVEDRSSDLGARLELLSRTLRSAFAAQQQASEAALLDEVADEVLRTLLHGGGPRDDVTLLLARLTREAFGSTRLTLPADPRSAPEGRRFVAAAVAGWGWEGLTETACLLTSEVIANAVLHAQGPLELTLCRTTQGLEISLSDCSERPPRLHVPSPTEESGRGLLLLDTLADRWGTRPTSRGKTVWFELVLAAEPVRGQPFRVPGADRVEPDVVIGAASLSQEAAAAASPAGRRW